MQRYEEQQKCFFRRKSPRNAHIKWFFLFLFEAEAIPFPQEEEVEEVD